MSETAGKLLELLRGDAARPEAPMSVSQPPGETGLRVEFPNAAMSPIDRLVIDMNHEGDIDVEVHVPGHRGAPFTWHFPFSPHPEFLPDVAGLVRALLADELVLARRSGWLRARPTLVEPERLRAGGSEAYDRIVSWSGEPAGP